MLKIPTRAPRGFKPFIFFHGGRWHFGSSFLMLDRHIEAARVFVKRLNAGLPQ